MRENSAFVKFWQGVVANTNLPLALRHYAVAILLSYPSSCDAERAISMLNRVVTALRDSMSWSNIRMHLIGAEDINPDSDSGTDSDPDSDSE